MGKNSTTNKKDDFIRIISEMSDTEINDFIKKHGKGPKPVAMCYIVDKSKNKKDNETKPT